MTLSYLQLSRSPTFTCESSLPNAQSMTLPECNPSCSLIVTPSPFLQPPTRTPTTLLPSQRTQYWHAILFTLDPLVSFAPAYLVMEEHSCSRQRIDNAANPLSCSGRYRCAQCGEKNAQAPLYPSSSSCTSSSYYQPLFTDSSFQSFTSNGDEYAVDRPFAAYNCLH